MCDIGSLTFEVSFELQDGFVKAVLAMVMGDSSVEAALVRLPPSPACFWRDTKSIRISRTSRYATIVCCAEFSDATVLCP